MYHTAFPSWYMYMHMLPLWCNAVVRYYTQPLTHVYSTLVVMFPYVTKKTSSLSAGFRYWHSTLIMSIIIPTGNSFLVMSISAVLRQHLAVAADGGRGVGILQRGVPQTWRHILQGSCFHLPWVGALRASLEKNLFLVLILRKCTERQFVNESQVVTYHQLLLSHVP